MKWGLPPWTIDVPESTAQVPDDVDVAVVGGGFTGLAAACWLRRRAPERTVAVLEAGRIGAGASGRTGGLVLDESAAGRLSGLGEVLQEYESALHELSIDAGFRRTDAWDPKIKSYLRISIPGCE